ncbi:MAG: hypothetical protein WEA10_09200 [Actinomycetota bacterium]
MRFVLIGGYAGSVRGTGILTKDLDVCCARDDENLIKLAAALTELHATLRGVEESVPLLLDPTTLRNGDSFTFVTDAGALDVLGTPSGTNGFGDLVEAADDMDLGNGVVVKVASVYDLIRMKRASARTKDLLHVEQLAALRDEIEGRPPPG